MNQLNLIADKNDIGQVPSSFISPCKPKDTLMLWNTPDDREFLEEQFN